MYEEKYSLKDFSPMTVGGRSGDTPGTQKRTHKTSSDMCEIYSHDLKSTRKKKVNGTRWFFSPFPFLYELKCHFGTEKVNYPR